MIRKLADYFAGRRLVADMRAVERLNDYYWDEEDETFYLCTEIDDDEDWYLDEFEPYTMPRLVRAAVAIVLISVFPAGLIWLFARGAT